MLLYMYMAYVYSLVCYRFVINFHSNSDGIWFMNFAQEYIETCTLTNRFFFMHSNNIGKGFFPVYNLP